MMHEIGAARQAESRAAMRAGRAGRAGGAGKGRPGAARARCAGRVAPGQKGSRVNNVMQCRNEIGETG